MGIITWLAIGTVAGLLVNWLLPGRFPFGIAGTVTCGVAGALLGGTLFSLIAGRGITGFDALSLVIAFAGAALVLSGLRLAGLARRRDSLVH